MKNSHRFVIIMAGGIGSRFWPYSREEKPKQFLDILGTGSSLLQITFKRFQTICPIDNIYVVSNQRYHDLISEQLPEIKEDQVLLEPFQRNTAPCIAYACTEKASGTIFDLDLVGPVAIILGSEEDGISDEYLRKADYLAKIQLFGEIESLNVSAAAAITIFEVVRQRVS